MTGLDIEPLAHDGHQHIDRDCDLDLRLHCILACAVESLDAQMLLDPAKEQSYGRLLLVALGDSQRWKREVVGEEPEPLADLRIAVGDAPERVRIYRSRSERG